MIYVGTMLDGYCEGFFGRGSHGQKRIEAIGADWLVVREDDGRPDFAVFASAQALEARVRWWLKESTPAEAEVEGELGE